MSAPVPPPLPPAAPGGPPRPHSPASRRIRTLISVAFLAVWLAAVLFDFLVSPEPRLPLWFQMTGVLVLGFVLGFSLDDVRPGAGGGARP